MQIALNRGFQIRKTSVAPVLHMRGNQKTHPHKDVDGAHVVFLRQCRLRRLNYPLFQWPLPFRAHIYASVPESLRYYIRLQSSPEYLRRLEMNEQFGKYA